MYRRSDWKGVILSSELTPGRRMLDKQHNPRLWLLNLAPPQLCRTVYPKGLDSHSLCQYKRNTHLGRIRWQGSGMGMGWSAPGEVSTSKSMQADVPLGTGSGPWANLFVDMWQSSQGDQRAGRESTTTKTSDLTSNSTLGELTSAL